MKYFLWATSLLAFIPLFLTSTVTCGCEPEIDTIAGQMSIYAYPGNDPTPTVAAKNESLGKESFIGKPINTLTRNGAEFDSECKFANPRKIQCKYWVEVGVIYSIGRDVTISAGSDGIVNHVKVREISEFF